MISLILVSYVTKKGHEQKLHVFEKKSFLKQDTAETNLTISIITWVLTSVLVQEKNT